MTTWNIITNIAATTSTAGVDATNARFVVCDVAATTSTAGAIGTVLSTVLVSITAKSSTSFPRLKAHKNLSLNMAATSSTVGIDHILSTVYSKSFNAAATSSTAGADWNRSIGLVINSAATSSTAAIDIATLRRLILDIATTTSTSAISAYLDAIRRFKKSKLVSTTPKLSFKITHHTLRPF